MKNRNFKSSGYSLRKVETQIGDSKKEKSIRWYVTFKSNSKKNHSLTIFLAEYNTVTRQIQFRNYKNQLVNVNKMGPRVVDEYVWAMASELFNKFIENDLFRPQYGLMCSK